MTSIKFLVPTCLAFTIFILLPFAALAQDDLMSLLEEVADSSTEESEKTIATFKTTRVVNAQTTELLKAKTLIFNMNHRFGNLSTGGHGLFGLDNASNIRFAFLYALTDKWMIGVGRSKINEHLDASTKIKILGQTTDDKIPVSMAWYSNVAFTPRVGPTNPDGTEKWWRKSHRFSYTHQLIIARKFNSAFSFEILPTLVHRNYVVNDSLIRDGKRYYENNDLFALGFATRLKITKRMAIVVDYFHTFSEFRRFNKDFAYNSPLGIGIEIETGGHIFHINFTNTAGVIENDFIPNSPDAWNDGAVKIGFNIGRVFYL